MDLHPLLLEPIYKEKVWGGRRLETLGRSLPGGPDAHIGESWEVADLPSTSPSGGGGSPTRSIVVNGPLAGRSLAELMQRSPEALLGPVASSPDGGFPLLVKYLDARESLSIQVHPSPAYAATRPDVRLKSEAWYVVSAEPGARIYKGLAAGIGRAEMEAAIREGTVPEVLESVVAVSGSAHYLPSGTCHGLGGGVMVAEVQTPSDTTFRVFDWGRTHRELHVEEALASMTFGPVDAAPFEPGTRSGEPGLWIRNLVRCSHFSFDEWSFDRGMERSCRLVGPDVWMVVRGSLTIRPGSGDFEPVVVRAGRTAVLPAALLDVAVRSGPSTVALRITIPS